MRDPIDPMLATAGPPPTGTGWAFELKWDGMRGNAALEDGQLRLTARPRRVNRPGSNVTDTYPELGVLRELTGGRSMVLDGEIVALADGRPSFRALQRRMNARPTALRLRDLPVSYYVFDLLSLDGELVTSRPYSERRALLSGLGLPVTAEDPAVRVVVPAYWTDIDGGDLLAAAREHGLEGIVAKELGSLYRPGRSRHWVKTRLADYGNALAEWENRHES